MILKGGIFPTVPGAEALAIGRGKIVALGREEEILAKFGGEAEAFDPAGMAVLPGFIDPHTHPLQTGLSQISFTVDLADLTRGETLAALGKACHDRGAGELVTARGWDEENWTDHSYLTRVELALEALEALGIETGFGDEWLRIGGVKPFADGAIGFAFGSDCMPLSPLYGLHAAVNAPHPEQRVPLEGIRAYTGAGAYFAHEEDLKGAIAPGMFAAPVVLKHDPRTSPEGLSDLAVGMTFVGGKLVYKKEDT